MFTGKCCSHVKNNIYIISINKAPLSTYNMSTVVLTLIGAKPPKPVNKTLTMGRVEQLSSGKWRKMPFVSSESNGEEGQQTISQLTRDLASCCG